MSIYVNHKDVDLKNGEGYFELKLDFIPSEVLIGFDKFKFSYDDKDHHVKEFGMSINSNFDGKSLKCTVKGILNDGSGHKLKTGNVRISIAAYANESTQDMIEVSALQGFNLKFNKDDHHVGRYAVNKIGSFMEDGSGNQAICSCNMSKLTKIPRTVVAEMNSANVHFINCFGMGMYKGDHHVAHIGIEVSGNADKIAYDLSDKSGNHAECGFCEFDVPDNVKDNFLDKMLALNTKGSQRLIAGDANILNIAVSHIQGVVKYDNYYIMSHDNSGNSKGIFIVSDGKNYKKFDSYDSGYNHPDGMQRYENYMFVGVENSSHNKSYIRLYDLSDLSLSNLPRICENFAIERSSTGTCALGVCRLKNQYIIAAYAPHGETATIDFYTASADVELPKTKFTQLCAVKTNHSSYQNIALYGEQSGKMYLVGFRSCGTTSEIDYIDLFEAKIKDNNIKLEEVYTRHVYTVHGSMIGVAGVHFRWGAGLDIDRNGNIVVLATQRNFLDKKTMINEFH